MENIEEKPTLFMMGEKTKILAVGDVHGDRGLVEKLAKKAKEEHIDIVILAGDLTHMGESDTDNLIGPFIKEGKEVLIIPGNWDSPGTMEFLEEKYAPETKNLHGYSIEKGDLGIFGAGGAEGPGPGATTDKEILKTLEKAHARIENRKKKIMLTHMHPSCSESEFSGVRGSKGITEAIKRFKPDVLIHGHIHGGGGIEEKIGETQVVNVSRTPTIFEI